MRHLLSTVQATLAQRYLVKSEIGRGSMAGVFAGWDHDREREVAIKVLRPEFGPTIIAERFHREIGFLSILDHPNILPILDSGEVDELVYFTMPFAQGDTLAARISEGGPLAVDEAVSVTQDLAAAIDYAHSKNIIHRDIKPENVVFIDDSALICDFGIARALVSAGRERLSSSGLIVGTPEYMSPEQASGERDIDHTTDIYALGCVAYTMLAGEPPFSGPTTQAILAKHIASKVPSLRVVRPEVPEHVERAIEGALAKESQDRPARAARFAATMAGG